MRSRSETPTELELHVAGNPAPQGSKTGFAVKRGGAYTGKVAMMESSSARLEKWRADVRADVQAEAQRIGWQSLTGAVALQLEFYLPRPKSHYRTGRNAHMLKDSAPRFPATVPDIDKLDRAVIDALDAVGIFDDDKQIIDLHSTKHYAGPAVGTGCDITITNLEGATA